MRMLLRLALACCPRAFRATFSGQIAAQIEREHGFGAILACANVAGAGIALHFDWAARDIALAVRALVRAPLYAGVCIGTIALAIGASVAIASTLEGVLFKPLPYSNGARLAFIADGADLTTGEGEGVMSYPNAVDVVRDSTTVEGIALSTRVGLPLLGFGRPVGLTGALVNGTFFDVLGVRAVLGRMLQPRDAGTVNVVVSEALWRRYLGASTDAIGRWITLGDARYTIVGVAPATMRDPHALRVDSAFDYWLPLKRTSATSEQFMQRWAPAFIAVAILRPRVTLAAARADVDRVLADLARRYPPRFARAKTASITPIVETLVGPVRPLLWLLYTAVSVVVLIACANVANLTLARLSVREHELLVRSAIGASRARVVAQVATESAVIAFIGGALGIAGGWIALSASGALAAQILPRWENVTFDPIIFGYALVLIALTTVLTGVLPALLRRRDLTNTLKSADRANDRSSRQYLRAALVAFEIALALPVVASAGLVVKSFMTLTHVDLGFDAHNLYAARVTVVHPRERLLPEVNRSIERIARIPGVTSVASTLVLPFYGDAPYVVIGLRRPGLRGTYEQTRFNAVTRGYFHTAGISLVAGRTFTQADDTAPVVVVSEQLAHTYFGTDAVIGKQVRVQGWLDGNERIVGVVRTVRDSYSDTLVPQLYFLSTQTHAVSRQFIIRTSRPIPHFAEQVTTAIADGESSAEIPAILPYSTLLARDALASQAATLLFGGLGAISLLLALAGIYAVTSFLVEQRTHEFAIRRALGARATHVLTNVFKRSGAQGAIGILIGFSLTAALTHLLTALLFETSPLDGSTLAAAIVLLVGSILLASLIPALRATRVDPAAALRYE